ncbi:hypothetical protein AB1N83_001378 [Pleurotus pulmonarius]
MASRTCYDASFVFFHCRSITKSHHLNGDVPLSGLKGWGNGEAHSPFTGVDFRQVHPAVGYQPHRAFDVPCKLYNFFFRPHILRQSPSSIAPTAGRYFFKPTMLSTGEYERFASELPGSTAPTGTGKGYLHPTSLTAQFNTRSVEQGWSCAIIRFGYAICTCGPPSHDISNGNCSTICSPRSYSRDMVCFLAG